MKVLKLNHDFAEQVILGKANATWRINDDKDLHVNDIVRLVDKVEPLNPSTWVEIGIARITRVLEKQLGKVIQQDLTENEKLLPIDELLKVYRTYYGPQVNSETPVKIISFEFKALEQQQENLANTLIINEVRLYSDGGSRGNPGPSACGYVLMDMNNLIISEEGVFLGVTTNNQAEYQSLKLGLEAALKHKATVVHVFMDSMLVVNQMKRIYKVKNQDLIPINNSVKQLVSQFNKVSFTHIPRERNRRADSKVNEILDAQMLKTP
jgi:ribonuclease HI